MAEGSKRRAPRIWWEVSLFGFAFAAAPTVGPFLSALDGVNPIWIYVLGVGLPFALIGLSFFRDVGPLFIERAEAKFQNRFASETYAIPVQFEATPTAVPGFSRLRAIRTDTRAAITPWSLRIRHAREVL